ncbi:hypothetical protein IQ260_01460 [Leptolyngbya cf. ectocarpi LEGE 11479]|uniref:Uncharacterized protein n=1 Tax=Leptolyngbya cf. ectocarpi LEGE 11479 TaxID=1828722 RepID=A0A928X1J9_LEPEC|nr:hypothetical protein [Leptolyngbya ectocarpi]MBE9065313.1 hypothetical protein [Leptolyngbya cf. ectocarpi LEGE 11479]
MTPSQTTDADNELAGSQLFISMGVSVLRPIAIATVLACVWVLLSASAAR